MKNKIQILQSISEETRLRIVMLLLHGELSVLEIVRALGTTQTKISRHLGHLKSAGLVTERRNANNIYYTLNSKNSSFYKTFFPAMVELFKNEQVIQKDYESLRKNTKHSPTHINKKNVLFVCVHNSARSQMAEAFLNAKAKDVFFAESAGFAPSTIPEEVISAMKERNINIAGNRSKLIHDLFNKGKKYQYVITVCTESQAGQCPVFPEEIKRLHWNIPDPLGDGGYSFDMERIKRIRNRIEKEVDEFLRKYS